MASPTISQENLIWLRTITLFRVGNIYFGTEFAVETLEIMPVAKEFWAEIAVDEIESAAKVS